MILRAAGNWAWTDRDESRQVFVLAAQAVKNPRTHAGSDLVFHTCMQFQDCLRVILPIGVHAANQAKVVGTFCDLWKNFADLQTALSAFVEFERRGEQLRVWIHRPFNKIRGQFFAVVANEERLVIEGVHVRRPSVHEEKDDALGPRRKMGFMQACGFRSRRSAGEIREKTGESEVTEAATAALQQLASGKSCVFHN